MTRQKGSQSIIESNNQQNGSMWDTAIKRISKKDLMFLLSRRDKYFSEMSSISLLFFHIGSQSSSPCSLSRPFGSKFQFDWCFEKGVTPGFATLGGVENCQE